MNPSPKMMNTAVRAPEETTQPPMPELRYFVSDKRCIERNNGDQDEEGECDIEQFLIPQLWVGASSLHTRTGRFSLVSVGSDITLLDFEEEDEDYGCYCDTVIRDCSANTHSSTDNMPTLPLRRSSSPPERQAEGDFMPKLPGRRISSTSTSLTSKSTIAEAAAVVAALDQESSLDSVRYTIATAGA